MPGMKILHAPQHMSDGLDPNLDTILALNPTVTNLTEQDAGARDNVAHIRAKVGHKYHVCSGPAGKDHAREIVVLVRKRLWRKILDVKHYQLSDAVHGANPGIGNDRHMIVVTWIDFGKVKHAHIATHWNAAIQDKDTGRLLRIPRAQVMEEKAGPLLEQICRTLYALGYYVTGGADFNYRDGVQQHRVWEWAPHNIFKRVKYAYRSIGLDYQWWSPNLEATTQETIEASTPAHPTSNHADHPWLLTTLKPLKAIAGPSNPR